jgi:hypothetical protein
VFFFFGAVMSGSAALLLGFPGSKLDAIWQLNPAAGDELSNMGAWAIALMGAVCFACAFAAAGVWRGARWGHRLAIGILVVNLLGDAASAIIRSDPRTLIGLPIGGAMIAYLLSRRVRNFFTNPTDGAQN